MKRCFKGPMTVNFYYIKMRINLFHIVSISLFKQSITAKRPASKSVTYLKVLTQLVKHFHFKPCKYLSEHKYIPETSQLQWPAMTCEMQMSTHGRAAHPKLREHLTCLFSDFNAFILLLNSLYFVVCIFFFNLNNMGFFHTLLKKEGGKELIISELKCNHGPIKQVAVMGY